MTVQRSQSLSLFLTTIISFALLFGTSCYGFTQHVAKFGRPTLLYAKNSLNKQAELRRKLELARQQNNKDTTAEVPSVSADRLSDKEMKERNDRLRFEELLAKGSSTVLNDFSNDGYLSKEQEEEEIDAARSGVERLFEGDPAPTECFEELVNMKTENAIGRVGMERLVPWLGNRGNTEEYRIIITDPRPQSSELRETCKVLLASSLTEEMKKRLLVVNADSPAENRRWMKRSPAIADSGIEVLSDEKMQFMRAYTALGEKRWSMTVYVIANERVQKLARQVDQYTCEKTIQNAVKSLTELRL